ncbi:unnamed protein product [Blepharisma stoltei]|uniref:LITAF domain-containing protein n=1 Tax=Blepharisma stoltei TaxID=1481888 RepID=A0AAU9J6Z8_9CILI|nr:unnamed protein product [Blepharisma stoltei]
MEENLSDYAASSELKRSIFSQNLSPTPLKGSLVEFQDMTSISSMMSSPFRKADPNNQTPFGRSILRESADTNTSTMRSFGRRRSSPRKSQTSLFLAAKARDLENARLQNRLQEKLKSIENEFKSRKSDTNVITSNDDPLPSRHTHSVSLSQLPFSASLGESKEAIFIDDAEEEFELKNDVPKLVWCAYCKSEVTTELIYINSSKTFWSAVGIFFMGGVFGCFLLPYMTNECKAPRIRCHKCSRPLNCTNRTN